MTATTDQVRAAQAEARKLTTTALGIPVKPAPGPAPAMDEFLDRFKELERCPHLAARPIQPWMLVLPWQTWRCQPCLREWAQKEARTWTGFGAVEEATCDRCRQYVEAGRLTPAMLRSDLWIIQCSLCKRCEREMGTKTAAPR
ncbi:hypothetical protein [Micromonospora zamorensis]|uniref:Zinc-ribbon domain-containing protein n=1 Tax=Micromonospora zamorensis TaxID=709883 RepID=A0ABZ1P8J6_9ACTN